MNDTYDEFHANKSERLQSFENKVKNIFDEKLKKFGDCFEKAKTSESVTHVKIFDSYGKYYFKKVDAGRRRSTQKFCLVFFSKLYHRW